MGLVEDIKTLFPDAKPQTGYMKVRCPFHKGGQERKPSMSIITKPHNGLEPGFFHCFTCGATGTFGELAEHFGFEYKDEADIFEKSSTERNEKKLIVATKKAVYKRDTPYQYSPYLASRGISEEIQYKFRVYEKPEEHKVYLPVFNRQGRYLYANARLTNAKKFLIEAGAKKTLAYIEEIDFSKPIAVCESQINALSLWTSGYARAVAMLGATNIFSLYAIKNAVGPFLLMFDGDEAGRKATEKAKELLGAYKCITFAFNEGEDVNSLWKACGFNSDLFFDELDKRRT